jgi:hypothetical protein
MKKRLLVSAVTALAVVSIMLAGCTGDGGAVGKLQFNANGEDFIRQGFISKDGWSLNFDHVYITLADVTACQTDPPYDPHSGSNMNCDVNVSLGEVYTLDLAEGGEDAPSILVGEVPDAPVGYYNALSWKVAKATSGPAAGYSLVIIGAAEKDGQSINFSIKVDKEYEYAGGEYVGDELKGTVEEGGTADLELTFHFDHIFGYIETPADDVLNRYAPGFEPFAGIAEGGELDVNMSDLQSKLSSEDYQMLVDILLTLGHVGDGHCYCHSE